MILTTCAACAKPIEHESRCAGCQTRYCSERCERLPRGAAAAGRCEEIANGGGAEQYHADKKYEEAVADSRRGVRGRHQGSDVLHLYGRRRSEEGLVRMCACRGAAGFAHVSCLAKQAKILWRRPEENILIDNIVQERGGGGGNTCRLCEQRYHGVVACALGWADRKTPRGSAGGARARGCDERSLGTV